jgi:gluconolactonase
MIAALCATANVEFGDADRKTLYIAARTSIYKIRTSVPGLP